MPLAEAAGHTVGQVLLDAAGVEIARFREEARDNRRVADLFTLAPEVSPRQAVPVVMTELRGWHWLPRSRSAACSWPREDARGATCT